LPPNMHQEEDDGGSRGPSFCVRWWANKGEDTETRRRCKILPSEVRGALLTPVSIDQRGERKKKKDWVNGELGKVQTRPPVGCRDKER